MPTIQSNTSAFFATLRKFMGISESSFEPKSESEKMGLHKNKNRMKTKNTTFEQLMSSWILSPSFLIFSYLNFFWVSATEFSSFEQYDKKTRIWGEVCVFACVSVVWAGEPHRGVTLTEWKISEECAYNCNNL